ncbi:MAG: ATP-dependent RecD-like DNA helicase [Desulfarculaceae bacterium]|nr:ATP-dependent RecD-like DNA helicase [Desulfarculaceae bacterium]
MSTCLTGRIERVTFTSDETNYTVCRVQTRQQRELVTVVGNIINPMSGEILEMKGNWVNNPKYGMQFEVKSYTTRTPASEFGIKKYLSSGLIKGIGPVMAERIVERFKEKSLDIIENDVGKLSAIDGIGEKRIEMIQKAWEEQKEIRNVMLFLSSYGVSSAYAAKIFKQYGNEAIQVGGENPYRLAEDIFGIGFATADKIAGQVGIERDSPVRIEAAVLHTLTVLAEEGHVCYPYDDLVRKVAELISVSRNETCQGVQRVQEQKKVILDASSGYVFLARYFFSEKGIASSMKRIRNTGRNIRDVDIDKALAWVQDQLTIRLADKQKEAVKAALSEKILVITGGPGTGKTTIINAIIKIYSRLQPDILLAAPTGRAAKKMSEATFMPAKTIHRLLRFSLKKRGFEKNEHNPLTCDILIVDEVSMIDTYLMHHLLKAVPDTCILLLVGDVNQLPSVGAGNVLGDVISSGLFPVVQLDTIFRQARKSKIIVNAHRINKGYFPDISRDENSDFFFIEKEEPEDAVNVILELVRDRVPNKFGFDPVNDIQVLTPMHKGVAGAANLNQVLRNTLNPGKKGLQRGISEFCEGDKVMQIRNNYDKSVFNGDIGRILRIDFDSQVLTLTFGSREIEYEFSSMDEIVHAYAVSIHKSQGSEYPVIILPVLTQHYVLLQRNLIYTAVTRGRKLVIVVGSKKALAIAVNRVDSDKRYTALQERLAG